MERKRQTQRQFEGERQRGSKIQRLKNRKENERGGKVIISFDPGIRQLNYHLLPITYDNNNLLKYTKYLTFYTLK